MPYLILFFWALGASTILPLSSEATLIYYLKTGLNPLLLLISAGVGNTLGSIINYYLGKKGREYLIEKNRVSQESLSKYQKIFNKFGGLSLLFSWLPVVGDPITMVAGVAKYPFVKFVFIVAFAKFARYGVLVLLMR